MSIHGGQKSRRFYCETTILNPYFARRTVINAMNELGISGEINDDKVKRIANHASLSKDCVESVFKKMSNYTPRRKRIKKCIKRAKRRKCKIHIGESDVSIDIDSIEAIEREAKIELARLYKSAETKWKKSRCSQSMTLNEYVSAARQYMLEHVSQIQKLNSRESGEREILLHALKSRIAFNSLCSIYCKQPVNVATITPTKDEIRNIVYVLETVPDLASQLTFNKVIDLTSKMYNTDFGDKIYDRLIAIYEGKKARGKVINRKISDGKVPNYYTERPKVFGTMSIETEEDR